MSIEAKSGMSEGLNPNQKRISSLEAKIESTKVVLRVQPENTVYQAYAQSLEEKLKSMVGNQNHNLNDQENNS